MSFTTLTKTQKTFLEQHLRGTGRTLSEAQARETYGIQNLSARISELRNAGLIVRTQTNSAGRTAYAISRRDRAGVQSRVFS